MNRLRVLQGDPNLSNISQGGYETAQDESNISIYYSMTEGSLTEDDSDETTVGNDDTIIPPLQYTVDIPIPNMIDTAGHTQTIPEICAACPTDKLPEIEQYTTSTENQDKVAHFHAAIVDSVEEVIITPIPQATTQISNEFNQFVSEIPPSTTNVCTKRTDEPTKSADDMLVIGNQQKSFIYLAAGHLSTIEEIDEISDLRPNYSSKPLKNMINNIISTAGVEISQIDQNVLPDANKRKNENTATGGKGAVKKSTRVSLSTQHRQNTNINIAGDLSSIAEVDKGLKNAPSRIVPQNNPPLRAPEKTRQSLASKTRSPFKRNGLRHSMGVIPASQAAGSSKMSLRCSTRLSVAHAKMPTLKINPKSPSKAMASSSSRPIVKSPLKPTAVAVEATAVAATLIQKSYVCDVCRKVFLTMARQKSHMRTHKFGKSSSNMCKYCDINFDKASALDRHLRENCAKIPCVHRRKLLNDYVPQRPSARMLDNFTSSSSGTPHSGSARKMPHSGISRTPSKHFRCLTCGQKFKDINSYAVHSDTTKTKGTCALLLSK